MALLMLFVSLYSALYISKGLYSLVIYFGNLLSNLLMDN